MGKKLQSYSLKTDKTVTNTEAQKGSMATPGNYRGLGGRHEMVLMTNVHNALQSHPQMHNNSTSFKFSIPKPNSQLSQFAGKTIFTKTARIVEEKADLMRSSTSLTVLSGPDNSVAFHTNAHKDTTGQKAAHELLRDAAMEIMTQPPTTKGLSEKSITVAMGGIAVASMAPQVLQQKRIPNYALKAKGKSFAKNIERRRNQAKSRLSDEFKILSPNEKKFALGRIEAYYRSLSGKLPAKLKMLKRRLQPNAPSSPIRNEKSGLYDPMEDVPELVLPPSIAAHVPAFITQPFRNEVR